MYQMHEIKDFQGFSNYCLSFQFNKRHQNATNLAFLHAINDAENNKR